MGALLGLGKAILRGQRLGLQDERLRSYAESSYEKSDCHHVSTAVAALDMAQMEVKPKWRKWAKTANTVHSIFKNAGDAQSLVNALKMADEAGLPSHEVEKIKAKAKDKATTELEEIIASREL